ncbi:hypothetical protein PAXRUDRAFT_833999 [Paxillus rubicundulus Ve08.2h10]|uniref:Uncharacterized protein n=1 Tax=Paxillus rubicundulus Ve08.2h10 TaxID=930991 RepID=A0A0D0C9R5_9AGAM|nr:hypothetical protein PAXRUDRAFT_833999 [Paxillus rubicundulus Ve08.2h10]
MPASPAELAITFATTSPFLSDPLSLAGSHPTLHNLQYTKPAGSLTDVLVFAVPPENSGAGKDEVMQTLKNVEGVLRVDVLEPRRRQKRDEF